MTHFQTASLNFEACHAGMWVAEGANYVICAILIVDKVCHFLFTFAMTRLKLA